MSINHCPEKLSKVSMQAVSAPYNFVPLSHWVHTPEWDMQVSHDWPFRDGVSGEIQYRLIAKSSLLVGGHQNPATENEPGQVHPFKLPDGRYAIPGASLKGMLRSVVEIAGFGRMRMVDDLRPGLRDISDKSVSQSYADKVRNRVKTGFLRQRADGGNEIVPCKMVRLNHRKLEQALDEKKPIFKARINVSEKYKIWQKTCSRNDWKTDEIKFRVEEHEAVSLGNGQETGFPVFTGQISDSTQKKGKYKDFVFYDADDTAVINVQQDVWRDFLSIHGDDGGKDDMSWPGHWRSEYRKGHQVPVFYIQDNDSLRLGLAYMPKLAGDYSIHDTICHASDAHLQSPGAEHGYDFADLLFGAIGEKQQDSLRGRVSCETAIADGNPQPEVQPDTILNGPKASYFTNYIAQNVEDSKGRSLRGTQYTTYMNAVGTSEPRGFKRYPARPQEMTGVQKLNDDQLENKKVQVRLHPLPAGTEFTGRIIFHNLKEEELGALLWAITWGGDESLRHGLGMAKSFGFGQVHFKVVTEVSRFEANDPAQNPVDASKFYAWQASYSSYMEKMAERARVKGGWRNSPQIANLMAMADPGSANKLPRSMQLRHMCMNSKQRVNEFLWAKQKGLVLADYAESSSWKKRQEERQLDLKQKRESAEAEARKKAELQAEAKKQAEFNALPAHQKAIQKLSDAMAEFPEGPTAKDRFGQFQGIINTFVEEACQWQDDSARKAMADAITAHYKRVGWHSSGLNKKQRNRKKKKNEDNIQMLINGCNT